MSMASVIVPKSDQMNADDLIAGPRTIRIRQMSIAETGEQRVSIFYDGDGNKPWKPCKSMCRVLVSGWGKDSAAYVGRSVTLYRDEKVTWAGMAVGGIRISHMSHLERDMTMALTATKGKKVVCTVRVLKTQDDSKPEQKLEPASDKILSGVEALEKQIQESKSIIDLDFVVENKDVETRRNWLRQHRPELSKRIEDAIAARVKLFGSTPESDGEDDFLGDEPDDKERAA